MLSRLLAPRTEAAYALLRVVCGLLYAFHGMQKLFGVLSDFKAPAGSQLWVGAILELVCGLAIAAGALTPWAAFLASGEMAVAYFMVHAAHGFWPILNKGELAVVYCFVFLFIAAQGGGIWSVDSLRSSGKTPDR